MNHYLVVPFLIPPPYEILKKRQIGDKPNMEAQHVCLKSNRKKKKKPLKIAKTNGITMN